MRRFASPIKSNPFPKAGLELTLPVSMTIETGAGLEEEEAELVSIAWYRPKMYEGLKEISIFPYGSPPMTIYQALATGGTLSWNYSPATGYEGTAFSVSLVGLIAYVQIIELIPGSLTIRTDGELNFDTCFFEILEPI